MPETFDQLHKRTQQRDLVARQRMLRRKREKTLRYVTLGSILAVCLLILIVLVARGCQDNHVPGESTTASTQMTTLPTEPSSTPPTQPIDPETVISLTFGGDLNVTDAVVTSGELGGQYDYTDVLMDAAALFASSDAAFLNLEGSINGAPYGTDSASAPQELLQALADAGVDMIQLANSFAIRNGLAGLRSTINAVHAAGMRPLGVFSSAEDFRASQGFTLCNINGVRVAIVAFTKGMDGMSLPTGGESCVNLLYKDYATTYQTVNTEGITSVLQAAQAQKPDVTIALVHWGSEYNDSISPTQEKIAELMLSEGVDAIVGTHSHFVQQIVYDQAAGTVIAYSLGDFLGNGEKAGTNYSILLHLEITKDNLTGETRITGCDYTGLYTLTPDKDGEPMRIVQIETAMALYENNHVSKVSERAYLNMQYAWQRILSRVGLE